MFADARRIRAAGLALALALAAGACTGTEDTRPPTWSFISTTIVEPNCGTAGCHSTFAQTAGVILDSRAAGYQSLTGGDRPYVRVDTTCVNGEPPPDQHSQLLDLLRSDQI